MTIGDVVAVLAPVAMGVCLLLAVYSYHKTDAEEKQGWAFLAMMVAGISLLYFTGAAYERDWGKSRDVDVCFEVPLACEQIDAFDLDRVIDDALRDGGS